MGKQNFIVIPGSQTFYSTEPIGIHFTRQLLVLSDICLPMLVNLEIRVFNMLSWRLGKPSQANPGGLFPSRTSFLGVGEQLALSCTNITTWDCDYALFLFTIWTKDSLVRTLDRRCKCLFTRQSGKILHVALSSRISLPLWHKNFLRRIDYCRCHE